MFLSRNRKHNLTEVSAEAIDHKTRLQNKAGAIFLNVSLITHLACYKKLYKISFRNFLSIKSVAPALAEFTNILKMQEGIMIWWVIWPCYAPQKYYEALTDLSFSALVTQTLKNAVKHTENMGGWILKTEEVKGLSVFGHSMSQKMCRTDYEAHSKPI